MENESSSRPETNDFRFHWLRFCLGVLAGWVASAQLYFGTQFYFDTRSEEPVIMAGLLVGLASACWTFRLGRFALGRCLASVLGFVLLILGVYLKYPPDNRPKPSPDIKGTANVMAAKDMHISGIRKRMPKEQVLKILGPPKDERSVQLTGALTRYKCWEWSYPSREITVLIIGDKVASVEGPELMLRDGPLIRRGHSRSKVRNILGKPSDYITTNTHDGYGIASREITIFNENSKVQQVLLGESY